MALDLGTTGTRAILFTDGGEMVTLSYQEWPSFYPSPAEVEQEAMTWWTATRDMIQETITKSGVDPTDIASVAVTNQRETTVPVDEDGVPLANAIVWQDRRTIEECAFIDETIGKDAIYKTTGLTIDPYFSSSKILWFKKNRPEIYAGATKFLLVHDFIVHKLTGQFVTDQSNASRTMLFDITTHDWSDEILSQLGLDRDKLPDVKPSGTVIGNVLPGSNSGLAPSTLVVSGAGDQQCAAIGVGVTEEGKAKCTIGTGTFLLAFTGEVKLDPRRRVLCSCGAIENTYVMEASMFSTGSLLRWARDTVGIAESQEAELTQESPYQVMDKKASASPPGSNGLFFLPFLTGAGAPYWNPDARGTLFGLAAGHTRNDIYRSILEGTAYDVRKNIDIFCGELGLCINELRLAGGGSRSDIWSQILADATGVTCLRPKNEEATAIGAAMLAATGAGIFQDVASATEQFVSIARRMEPDPAMTARYEVLMGTYTKLYDTLNDAGLFADLKK
jgi:D-xylulose kinase